MKDAQLILGNQLFPVSYYSRSRLVFMCEDVNLCNRFKYHKHKIIFFLASMRTYWSELQKSGFDGTYEKIGKGSNFEKKLAAFVNENGIGKIFVYEIEDKFFERFINAFCTSHDIELYIEESPMFLHSRSEFKDYLKTSKKPFMKTFYEAWRRKSGVLMEEGLPLGGKYSFDADNRKKIPKKHVLKESPPHVEENKAEKNVTVKEVARVVNELFSEHPGNSSDFWLATSREEALQVMERFFKERFSEFGVYEDAIDERNPFLYHSVLSPYINIGFLLPSEVLEKALNAPAPLNSKEGYIRQVAGWREFIRGIYQNYSEIQESENFFAHDRKLANTWYLGSTGLDPLDHAISKALKFAYNHHIERLMIISNVMLLCEVDPKQVYKWFMEMYADSSDWVMAPNVYGMGQFSDGGIFATKPYICGSNYIIKMSHYKKGDWSDVLDGLYWRFIHKNRGFFSSNYRLKMMVSLLDKMPSERKKLLFEKAENFIEKNTYIEEFES